MREHNGDGAVGPRMRRSGDDPLADQSFHQRAVGRWRHLVLSLGVVPLTATGVAKEPIGNPPPYKKLDGFRFSTYTCAVTLLSNWSNWRCVGGKQFSRPLFSTTERTHTGTRPGPVWRGTRSEEGPGLKRDPVWRGNQHAVPELLGGCGSKPVQVHAAVTVHWCRYEKYTQTTHSHNDCV